MARLHTTDRPLSIFLALLAGALIFFAARAISNTESIIGLAIVIGMVIAIITFIWPEAGLYVLIFSMLLGPEMIVGSLTGGTTASRGVTLRVDDFLLTIIAFTWFARTAVHKELGLFLSTPLNRPIAAYLTAAAVSTAVGMLYDHVRPVVGFFFVLKFVEYVFVYFAAVNFIRTKTQIRRLVIAIFITGILVSIYAAIQIPLGVRVTAPFEGEAGEPNTLGGYLLFLLALLGGLIITSGSLRQSVKFLLAGAVLGVPFLYTLSRASYLGLLGVAIALVLFSRQRIIAVFSVVAAALILLLVAPPEVVERVEYTFGGQGEVTGQIEVGSVRLDTSTSARLQSFSDVLRDFPRSPILGFGVTGHGFIDGQYPKILIEMGLVGLAVFFWLVMALFRQALEALRISVDWQERGICIGYLAGLFGLLLHALGSNTFIIVRIMEPFWFMTGVMTLLYMINTERARAVEEGSEPLEEEESISFGLVSPRL